MGALSDRTRLELDIRLGYSENVARDLEKINVAEKNAEICGINLLHAAVEAKVYPNILEMIIAKFKEKKVSLDIENDFHRTALDFACENNKHEAIKILIKAGANYHRPRPKTPNETYLQFYLRNNPDKQAEINELVLQQQEQQMLGQGSSPMTFLREVFRSFQGYQAIRPFDNGVPPMKANEKARCPVQKQKFD